MEQLDPRDPTSIGPFTLLGRLGAGGMGRVYLGRLPSGRRVAIKVVHEHLAADPRFRMRFSHEVGAAKAVGGFWTAAIVDADPNAPSPWLASEYIVGPTLETAIETHGPLGPEAARIVLVGLTEALIAIHRVRLIHRDLKPANVLLAQDGPRVIDFGIARALDQARLTQPGLPIGSASYMSPEQALGTATLTPASDIFSLGGVLVFAAAGHPPFTGASVYSVLLAVANGQPDLTGVPARLAGIAAACLAKDPSQRPTTADLLDELTRTTPTAPGKPSVDRRNDWWLRRR